MATAYIVAATPSSPEPKRIANLKSAKAEADARAKLDRVDVEVRTVATGKLTYTAQGAPAQAEPAPAAEPAADADQAPADDTQGDEAADGTEDGEDEEDEEDEEEFDAMLTAVIGEATETAARAALITAALEGAPDEDADDDADSEPQGEQDSAPADDNGGHRGQADCGCSVEKIIATGEHDPKVCANVAKEREAAQAVERDRPARPARRTGGGGGARRDAQGPSVASGWDLLYDKPRQKAQVGRNAEGKYALICTVHKHVHPLVRLVQERGLRGGKRSVWCPQCTD